MAYNTNQDRLAHKTVTNLEQSLGKHGITIISGETEVNNLNGVAVQFITQCQVSELVISGTNFKDTGPGGGAAFTSSYTFSPGTIIYGNVTKIKLETTSQFAIVYNA